MAKIKTPVAKFNGESAGVTFVNGEGHTDDENKISWFEKHGYFIGNKKETTKPEETPPEISLDSMTVKQLKSFTKDNNIDIGKASTKEDILSAIVAEGNADGNDNGGDDTDDEG